MNHIYRSVWNESTGTVTAVSEHAKRGGKKTSRGKNALVSSGFVLKSVSVAVALAYGSASHASPQGGTVVAGNANITRAAGNTTITQTSQNAALNWQSFDIGIAEAVRFVQPNANAVALNRVLGADPSNILGSLSANGKVFLINPNGILFGKSAQVNVGGLVASTRGITDSDFLAARYEFNGDRNSSVVNQGSITAEGGYVALLGAHVSNQGVIAAKLGSVVLAAGNALTLDVAGDGLLNVTVNAGAVDALVQNGGLIQADGGQVLLTAQSASTLLQSAVNNTGVIQAQTIENRNGTIKLLGDMRSGTVNVTGTLDASAPKGGDGGFIDTSAAQVKVASGTKITTAAAQGLTGSWLIDPTDYTIAATGGNITGAALSSNLASTNVSILSSAGNTGTAGDVNVNDVVTWSANKLTLNAQNNININANLNASASASLALQYGQGAVAAGNTSKVITNGAAVNLPASTINFTTLQGSDGVLKAYTVITSLGATGSTTATDLQGITGNLAGNFALGANIDATATSGWEGGAGFAPIVGSELVTAHYGNSTFTYTRFLPFTGSFDGLGHTIGGLTINRPTAGNGGLFGLTAAASTIRNVGLVGGSVTGFRTTGALVGYNYGTINNSYATGTVSANPANGLYVGGLVGSNAGVISNSYATGAVNAQRSVGGLVGANTSGGSISRSYSTGAVTAGTYNSGGLVGNNDGGSSISDSYATGAVSGGRNDGGGLVGQNYGSISRSYATGSVTNTAGYVGGLAGVNGLQTGSITLSYSTGQISGANHVGGLVGTNFGQSSTITNSYWDMDSSGRATSSGGTGLTSVQMQTASNFAGFNFTTTPGAAGNNWVLVNVNGKLNNAGGALGATRPMLASEYSTTISNAHQLQLMSMGLTATYTLAKNIDAAATGTANDVWSGSTFIPVGIAPGSMFTPGTPFSGTFDGYGHTISNLRINLPTTADVGLFSTTGSGSVVRNVGLTGGSVTGGNYTGALIGRNYGSVSHAYSNLNVTGNTRTGGLLGRNDQGTVDSSYATGAVHGNNSVVGGLVGYGAGGTVSNSYATGAVSGAFSFVGGLLGSQSNGVITNSYATGSVSGSDYTGGLVGFVYNSVVSNTYATGALSNSGGRFGGLIGQDYGPGSHISNSYWNVDAITAGVGDVGNATLTNVVGLHTAALKLQANFTALDFNNTWVMFDTISTPLLRALMTTLTVTVNDAGKTYDGLAYSGGNGVTYSVTPDSNLYSGTLNYSGSAQGAVNAGNYAITAGGLSSTSQQGYLFTYVGGTLTVGRADLALSTSDVHKSYDGGLTAAGTATVSSGTLFGTDAISGGTFAFTDKNAGSGNKIVTVTGVTVTDGNGGGNYNVSYANNTTSTIDRAVLTATASTAGKIYDGNIAATATLNIVSGLANGETVGATGGATFNSKDVATANLVTVNSTSLADGTGLASNYSLASGQTAAAHITPKGLTASVVAADKVYDGNTVANATLNVISGLVDSETLGASGAATFNSKDVADANLVTVNSTTLIDGTHGGLASNYSLASGQTAAAHITPKRLTVAGQAAQDKEYDGTTLATLIGGSLVGLIAGETVGLNEAGAFATADPGNAIAITAADSLSGTAAANYIVSQPTGLAANITAPPNPPAPVIPETPAIPAGPESPEIPPADARASVAYQSAVSHTSSSVQIAPASISSPLSLGPALSNSNSGGSVAYDLAGLNLTVITQDTFQLPGIESRDATDGTK